MFRASFALILFCLYFHAAAQEEIYILFNEEQIRTLNYLENYSDVGGNYCGMGGMCFSLERVQSSLFLNADFVPGEKDTKITEKTMQATNGMSVQITGYNNYLEFLQDMEKDFYDDPIIDENTGRVIKPLNPLREASEFIQSMNSATIGNSNNKLYGDLDKQISEIKQILDEGVPLQLDLFGQYHNIDGETGHRIKVIGYETDSNGIIKDLIVLDSVNTEKTTKISVVDGKLKSPNWRKIKTFDFFAPKEGASRDRWTKKVKPRRIVKGVDENYKNFLKAINDCLRKN